MFPPPIIARRRRDQNTMYYDSGGFFEETNGIRSKFSAFMKARSNLTVSLDTSFILKVFCVELSSSLHKQIFAMSYEENVQFVYSFLLA